MGRDIVQTFDKVMFVAHKLHMPKVARTNEFIRLAEKFTGYPGSRKNPATD
jgi:hypothetical protein